MQQDSYQLAIAYSLGLDSCNSIYLMLRNTVPSPHIVYATPCSDMHNSITKSAWWHHASLFHRNNDDVAQCVAIEAYACTDMQLLSLDQTPGVGRVA